MRVRGFEVCKGYEHMNINLPKRATKTSAGYDIEAAFDTIVPSIWNTIFHNIKEFISGKKVYKEVAPTVIKTGVKAYFAGDEVMNLYVRSSAAIKRGMILPNSVGVFDSDYYGNESNDGEILMSVYNIFPLDMHIKKGERIGQCVFQKFLKIDNEGEIEETRRGGHGSTGK